jgi:hypothetical protein
MAESCRLWGVPKVALLSPNMCFQDLQIQLGALRIKLMAPGQC